ncbi:MAG TPA: YtxH domain-containing protein [Mycobacteriales bacterium]|jgi:hypothetical protein|nr:YtxH domain-containing protein [Mycobacteriales bacterium]
MKAKLALISGAAAGYVLGARAGRQQYEKIVSQATAFWQDPKVQQKVTSATNVVKEQVPAVSEKLTGAAKSATSSSSPEPATPPAPVVVVGDDFGTPAPVLVDESLTTPAPTVLDDPLGQPATPFGDDEYNRGGSGI